MNGNARQWFDGLEGTPLRIAETDDSPLLVLAGPGTGKTFALMRRVMRLLQSGVPPREILVATFTRTAANDLQNELARLGAEGADNVRAGTLHALCFALLSRAAVLDITGRVARPLLKFEERFLLEDLKGPNGQLRALKNRLLAFGADWARLQAEEPGWPEAAADRLFLAELTSWLVFHQGMLLAELVPEALRFLRENPASPDRPRFQHVLVDEYQDLNRAEQVLLEELASDGSLAVIGDEDQSIYSFRFAHPEGISTFAETHPGTADESLDKCRRCPKLVVRMAQSLIQNNPNRAAPVLVARDENPEGEVFVVQWESLEQEALGVVEFVRNRVEAGDVDPGKVLVLCPRRQIGYTIRDRLNAVGVPAHSFFSEEVLDGNPADAKKCKAQEAFALLTLLAKPDDRVALRCWCGFGSQSLQRGEWDRVIETSRQSGSSPREILQQLLAGDRKLPRTKKVVERFEQLRQRLDALSNLVGQDLIDELLPIDADWSETLRSVVPQELAQNGEPEDLLDALRQAATQPELPVDVEFVRLMSLHKSKGLTADLVVVVGCIDGFVPFLPDDVTPDEADRSLEEQRRLFYVAITRTRRTLVLSSATQIRTADALKMGARIVDRRRIARTIASRFFRELGHACPRTVRGETILPAN